MRHGLHFIVAFVGAGLVVLLSSVVVSAVWAGSGRFGVREIVTWAVCTLVVWVVLELKDVSMRRARPRPARSEGAGDAAA